MKRFKPVYDNYDEFFSALTEQCHATYQLLTKRSSHSIKLRNQTLAKKNIPEGDPRMLPSSFSFYSVTIFYTPGIEHSKKGKGNRQRRIIRCLGCGTKMKALTKRDGEETWKVVVTWWGYHNHIRSEERFRYYAENRRITRVIQRSD
ncbi:hypothetical protein PHMEG_00041573 [Phytophthora megakarya]|uniref:WRKY domain-containing protein n=1 Tax=Phytophthora megakarya TaxID=4795 RepID=A0A225UBM3_9STRA|nr:hypothetical protein PHMEG_00041573 [Phytophthora megakarya]